MSGISSSVGLASGINTGDLIDQLMQIEARSLTAVQERIAEANTEKAAWLSLSAGLLGVQSAANAMGQESTFLSTSATSSSPSVLNATSDVGAAAGSYQFAVRQLVQTDQMISAGFADTDTTAIGAGEITLELGHGRLDPDTRLDFLNGQSGVRRGSIQITDRDGVSATIDLTDAITVADVLDGINDQTALGVSARVVADTIVLTDTTGSAGTITVAEVNGGHAAADLGIAGSATDTPLVGQDISYITTDTGLDLLNDGNGIERTYGADMVITLRDATVLNVNLYGEVVGEQDYTAYTVGDVIDLINDHADNGGKLVASINDDGDGVKLVDVTAGGGNLTVADGTDSLAATQLGLAGTYAGGPGDLEVNGSSLIPGLNSVLLSNLAGGTGLTLGTLDLQDRDGNTTTIDLTSAISVSDIIEAINDDAGVSLQAELNDAGNGIKITDTTGSTDFHLVIADGGGGNAATVLGIDIDDAVSEVVGTNAQHKYISTHTRLDDLNGGKGWDPGQFTVTNGQGASVTVTLTATNLVRIEDVIEYVNAATESSISVTARLNDSGTGILLEDSSGGDVGPLTVSEVGGGTTASSLGLEGEANDGEAFLEGSFRRTITIGSDDTLQDLATAINDANMNISATIINDGSSVKPYRLILTSDVTGAGGQIVLDTTQGDLTMTTFVEGRDAVVHMGGAASTNPIVLTSSTNQLADVIEGVTLDLMGTDTSPVTVTIAIDTDTIVQRMESFAESFNSAIDNIKEYTQFDSESLEKGVLFGESGVSMLYSRIVNMVINPISVSSSFTRLSQVGFTFTSGNKLSFDETEFLDAYSANPDGVLALFTQAAETTEVTVGGITSDEDVLGTGGLGIQFENILEGMTDSSDGLISYATVALDGQTEMLNDRTEYLNEVLTAKRARLERQFAAMEIAIAKLQAQQSALSGLASLVNSFATTTS